MGLGGYWLLVFWCSGRVLRHGFCDDIHDSSRKGCAYIASDPTRGWIGSLAGRFSSVVQQRTILGEEMPLVALRVSTTN
jgi:hypothetical protein